MNYVKLVNEYIEKSGLALGEIAKQMNELGVKVDRSYLSKLRNNPKYPASEEINRALAKITGGDEDTLVFAAFMEKAPDVAKRYFTKISDLDSYLREFAESINDDNLKNLLDVIDTDEKINLFKIIAEDAKLQNKSVQTFLKEDKSTYTTKSDELMPYDTNDMVKLPIIGQIAAGQPIDCYENFDGFTCVDPSVLRGRDGFALRVKGDSMIGDRIHNGDIVVVVVQPEVLPTDIAVVRVNRGETTLKRVKIHGDFCILSPSNPSMEPMLVPAKDVEVIGKVVEVKFLLP